MHSGERYGYVNDVLIDWKSGHITALLMPNSIVNIWNFIRRREERIIPWEFVKQIGEEVILVDREPERRELKREKELEKGSTL